MSLDVWLTAVRPVQVYEDNITHNLAHMAGEVRLSNELTLYDVLWHPKEHNYTKASEIAPLLAEGLLILRSERDRLISFNPPNGWGNYENLVEFTQSYLNACLAEPNSEIHVSR